MNKFHKKQWWYLATVLGFAIGLVLGLWSWEYYESLNLRRITLFFWAFPAAGAGFGMGLAQCFVIRKLHKIAFLWMIATMIGIVIIVGGALYMVVITNYYRMEALPWLFSQLSSWFVPLAIITPMLIFAGPLFQWLMIRYTKEDQSVRGFLRLSAGWVFSIVILFIMLGLMASLVQSRNDILNSFVIALSSIPSGLIFAYLTSDMVKNPTIESRSL